MRHLSLRRTMGGTLALLALMAALGCGGGGGLTEPPPGGGSDGGGSDGGGSDGGGSEGPAPVGMVIYAVDNGNRLLMFGTESGSTISRLMPITGLPILKRIVGIDFRPSNGKLYGVGNDSRVYLIDKQTGAATPVGSGPFSPKIISAFDIHFGMGFDPVTDRIRLISTELGVNWSINPDDGTAVTGQSPRYAAGDPHEGATPRIAGLAYAPPAVSARSGAFHARMAQLAASSPCDDLMYAIDTELAEIIGSCDPDEGDFTSLGPIPGITAAACAELKFAPSGPLGLGRLWASAQRGVDNLNSIGSVDPESGLITWHVNVPDHWLIQSITFEPPDDGIPGGTVEPAGRHVSARLSAAASAEAPPADPLAHCLGTAGQ
ncbi:MAG TPA: DUF4394 domain-containing protein [Gemmatimonadales bacterium]|nr:DUF4394 domain-containing protein [Gemmatimonadales bacterium]